MHTKLNAIHVDALLKGVAGRVDAEAVAHSLRAFELTTAYASPKPPGLIARRRLLALARTAYAQDDMPALIDIFSKGLPPSAFTVPRQRLVNDPRIFSFCSGHEGESSVKLFDAAVFDNQLAWACLSVALDIPPEDDDTIPALFKPLLLDRPEFIELLVGSDSADLLLPRPGTCFALKNSVCIDLLGAAARLGATCCVQLLLEKVQALVPDILWGNQAKTSLQLAANFARLNYSRKGSASAQKLCSDLSAAASNANLVAPDAPDAPEFAKLILERLNSMSLRIEKLGARIEELNDENQALRAAMKPRGFDPLRLVGRTRTPEPSASAAPAPPGRG